MICSQALLSSFSLFSWVVFRLIYYPLWIIWSTSYEVRLTLDKSKYKDGPLYYYFFNTLLICLLVLNIYWWVIIYRVLIKQIRTRGEVEDVRSDSEDEEEKEDKKLTKDAVEGF